MTLFRIDLEKGDVIILKEYISDGWWKCQVNGLKSKIQITKFQDMSIRREKSDDVNQSYRKNYQSDDIKKQSQKSLPILPSKKLDKQKIYSFDDSMSKTKDTILEGSKSQSSILISPRYMWNSNDTIIPVFNRAIYLSRSFHESQVETKKKLSMRKRASRLFLGAKKKKDEEINENYFINQHSANHHDVRFLVKKDLNKISKELEDCKNDIHVIIKSLHEINPPRDKELSPKCLDERKQRNKEFIESIDKEYNFFAESPNQKILQKMIQDPYKSLFSTNNKTQTEEEIVLGIHKQVLYKELLSSNIYISKDFYSLNDDSNHDQGYFIPLLDEEQLSLLKSLDFDIFPFKDRDDDRFSIFLLMNMFFEFKLHITFNISYETLYRFLYMISRRYRNVPYHNFYHAFNVTQTLFFFLTSCNAEYLLSDLEILALLIAAIVHDCDHPGLNNDFQRKAQTKVYYMHKKSVLENHHYLHCIYLLSFPETNILSNLSPDQVELIFIYIRDLILSTDLAVHGIIMKSLKERYKTFVKYYKAVMSNNSNHNVNLCDEDRKLLMCCLLKCSDLSNEIRKEKISKKWANLVIEEFLMQSGMERKLDLPLTPFMDKERIIVAKEQINFIEKLCMPLYSLMSQIFPEMVKCCHTLEENRERWLRIFYRFYSNNTEALKKLSEKSFWEDHQVKTKEPNLFRTLAKRATNTNIVTTSKMQKNVKK